MSDPDHMSIGLELSGFVQGCGIRPRVARLAHRWNLAGSVGNDPAGVRVDLAGPAGSVQEFLKELTESLPPGSILRKCPADASLAIQSPFGIRASRVDRPCDVPIPRDIVICESCRSEVLSELDRRQHHAFNSCALCGPRYSLMDALPWDRERGTMRSFPLCSTCQQEYESPTDRRFHAQTISCPECGPALFFRKTHSEDSGATIAPSNCLTEAVRVLRQGQILAIKGVGGFQLLCDATRQETVEELRRRKRRISKPFAVMLHDPSLLNRALSSREAEVLNSPENPIVVLENVCVPDQASSVTCGLSSLGVMRPSTALHWLLSAQAATPLVVTSANAESEPLLFDDNDPECNRKLAELSDAILTHDRKILQPIDDSVVRVIDTEHVTLRAARGCAPWPLSPASRFDSSPTLAASSEQRLPRILALGANQKVALAISNGYQMALMPHLGDLSSSDSRMRFEHCIERTLHLYQFQPQVIVHDLHPDYFTTAWGLKQSASSSSSTQCMAVQHHHAHIAATMLEHQLEHQEVLGIAFDGSGFGPDGTIWGGEFLRVTSTGFDRVAALRPFFLVGGERAIREPWRVAVALLMDAMPELSLDEIRKLLAMPEQQQHQLDVLFGLLKSQQQHQQDHPTGGAVEAAIPGISQTSSMGRLFDGVASLVLRVHTVSFEGEAAMKLECRATESHDESIEQPHCRATVLSRSHSPCDYSIPIVPTTAAPVPLQCDWRPVIRDLVYAIRQQTPPSLLSAAFHDAVAGLAAHVALLFPDLPVVIGGGCFQNTVLVRRLKDHLEKIERPLFCPERVPVNDGGISAGQLLVAASRLATYGRSDRTLADDVDSPE